jgi:hypothetical protein
MPSEDRERATSSTRRPGPYSRLPEPVRLEDTITSQQAAEPPDPAAGQDPQRDFLLRNAG